MVAASKKAACFGKHPFNNSINFWLLFAEAFFKVSQNVNCFLVIADNAVEVLYFAFPVSFIVLKCRV